MKSKSRGYIYIRRKVTENSVRTGIKLDTIMNGKVQYWLCFSDNGCSPGMFIFDFGGIKSNNDFKLFENGINE